VLRAIRGRGDCNIS